MDEEKKKQINEAIEVLKDLCNSSTCRDCPMNKYNCNSYEGYCDVPGDWELID